VTDRAVVFDAIWKKFRLGEHHDSLRDLVPSLARRLLKPQNSTDLGEHQFWVLENVSFEVNRGDALGIIGPNGAGKSTTLKLLTKILRPTRGRCEVHGRVGALIEVAAGFHPDLTGRENINLQGAIMGMKRADIERRFADIVDFAEVGSFIDTQVKRYSTGMNARLGFSIAAHLDPDVLIIDEVLSVGDMAFQQRCVDRMRAFRQQGVTTVFVSHNLQAVSQLCSHALYLNHSMQAIGSVNTVIQKYLASLGSARASSDASSPLKVIAAVLTDEHGNPPASVSPGARLQLRVTYLRSSEISGVTLGFILYRSTDLLVVYNGNVTDDAVHLPAQNGTHMIDFTFRPHVTRGQYHIECHVFHNSSQRFLSRFAPAATFSVEETQTYDGIADIELEARPVGAPASAMAPGWKPP